MVHWDIASVFKVLLGSELLLVEGLHIGMSIAGWLSCMEFRLILISNHWFRKELWLGLRFGLRSRSLRNRLWCRLWLDRLSRHNSWF